MGCCNPNSYKQVEQQEEEVNLSGSESLPPWFKVSSALVVLTAVIWMLV